MYIVWNNDEDELSDDVISSFHIETNAQPTAINKKIPYHFEMTTTEKKQLYNEIMASLYETVSRIVDEAYSGRLNEAFESGTLKQFIAYAQEYARKHNRDYEIRWMWAAQSFDMFNVKYDGTLIRGTYRPALSELSDDNIVNGKFYKDKELLPVLKNHKP